MWTCCGPPKPVQFGFGKTSLLSVFCQPARGLLYKDIWPTRVRPVLYDVEQTTPKPPLPVLLELWNPISERHASRIAHDISRPGIATSLLVRRPS